MGIHRDDNCKVLDKYNPEKGPFLRRRPIRIDMSDFDDEVRDDASAEVSSSYGIDNLRSIAESIRRFGRNVHMARDSVLFTADLQNSWVYLVLEGEVDLMYCHGNGEELLVARKGNGDVIGEFEALGIPRCCTRAQAYTAVRCIRVPASVFSKKVLSKVEHLRYVINMMGEDMARLLMLTGEYAFDRLEQRLYHLLLDLSSSSLATIHHEGMLLNETRVNMAKYLGCSREATGRALNNLKNKEYVMVRGSSILVRGRKHI